MPRGKFDPKKAAGAPPAASALEPGGKPERPIGVSDLAGLITKALESGVPAKVAVLGEVSGASLRTHWYFSLKDDAAVVSCVMFASDAARSRATPEDGRSVVAVGRIGFFARQGRAQLYVERLIAAGEGDLERRFRALVEELRALGWFDPQRKRPIPVFPRRIAVVTSRTSAALQDVLDTTRRRCPAVEIAIVDVRVQGDDAAPQIAAAIRWLSAEHASLGIDAILVVRGGGSAEDLWAFNERIVADAIVHAAVPVVAAIGHETDTTIAELVADARAATPTQAAMRITPDRAALTELLDARHGRLGALVTRLIRTDRARLEALARRPGLTDPRRAITIRRESLRRAADALASAIRARIAHARIAVERRAASVAELRPDHALARRRDRLSSASSRLHRAALDLLQRRRAQVAAIERELIVAGPASVLARGYSLTTTADGAPIRSIASVRPGQPVRTRLADGAFDSTVAGPSLPTPSPNRPDPLPPRVTKPTRPRRTDSHHDTDQMRLF
jgi:exodeoxyribonuclease VII large subunit